METSRLVSSEPWVAIMSFIDFFKNLGRGGKAQSVTLSEAVAMIRNSVEAHASVIYPACERLCSAILVEVEEAKKSAEIMKGGKLDSSHIHYRIGLQMQKNFAERIPAAFDTIIPPIAKDYSSFARFQAASSGAIGTVAHILRDNRYLPFFFDEEIGNFGKNMNEILRLNGELGSALDSKKDQVSHLEKTQQLDGGIHALVKELSSLGELKNELTSRKSSLDSELSSAAEKNKVLGVEEGKLKQKIGEIDAQISGSKARITNQLSPLQRQFRKMHKKIIEKKDLQMLDAYADEAENTLVNEVAQSDDYPALRRILESMKKALENGELEDDGKVRMRRIGLTVDILGGSLIEPAKHILGLEIDLAEAEASLNAVSHKLSNIELLQHQIQQTGEQMGKTEKNEAEAREKLDSSILQMEELVKKETGKTVGIGKSKI